MKIDEYISKLKVGDYLSERELKMLSEKVKELLVEESNLQPVLSPVTICGDLHGQFYDVLELFNKGGDISVTNYIFMGDFVDRGYHSVETLELLLCYKVKYPDKITLLRGNHESRAITQTYGFYDEILKKYGNIHPWKYCTELFDYLPLAAIVDGNILCLHGGLSPSLKTLDQFRMIERKVEIPQEGALADIMWSDPDDSEEIRTFKTNPRGAGWLFGDRVTKNFNYLNDIEIICRAHQLVQEGYNYPFSEETLVTVWSAPNYCYRCGNQAAILEIGENHKKTFKVFKENEEHHNEKKPDPSNILPYFL